MLPRLPLPLAATAAVAFATALNASTPPPPQPNIIVMMLDDMGFSDLGCYGGDVQTPNLDAIAAKGVRFTQFRNNARCCPSRASLLTGLYPHQAGVGGMEGARKNGTKFSPYRGSLHENCVTLAEVLKPLGYRTYAVGKWHLGFPENQSSPLNRGFDHWTGVYEGWADYNKKVVDKRMLIEDDQIVETLPEGFKNITYFYTQRAIEYATQDPSKPFFIYLPHIAPHFNMGPLPENVAKYKGQFDEGWDILRERRFARQKELGLFPADLPLSPRHWRTPAWADATPRERSPSYMETYAATIDEVDQGVGQLVAALKATGQWDNTLFLFLSDNGAPEAPTTWSSVSNTPFSYFKQQLREGGMATPLIAHWGDRFPAGAINTVQRGHVKDIMATLIEVTGATYPTERDGKPIFPHEGKSLLHAMLDPKSFRDPGPTGWEHQGHRALIDGDYKLVALYTSDDNPELPVYHNLGPRTGKWQLFNMATDRTEVNDLAEQMPEKVAAMEKLYFAWAARAHVIEKEDLNRLWNLDAKDKKTKKPADAH